jgi:hypothetical protein
MKELKEVVKRIPGVPVAYHEYVQLARKLRTLTRRGVFTDIYVGNKFGGKESVSGPGSDPDQTRVIINELPTVFRDFNIRTILDSPCGDFHWMKRVNLKGVDYTGSDIVVDLIRKNKNYAAENVHFCEMNLLKDKLPKVDLVLCRDCLVHFSFRDILLALHNICNSESTYLLTTTFTNGRHNQDISTGQWRVLNLEAAPFMFPAPLRTINEECTEGDGAYKDKSLGLWRVADIRDSLAKRHAI